jgi:hypothetical protein
MSYFLSERVRAAPAGAVLVDRERRAAPQSSAANHTHPRDGPSLLRHDSETRKKKENRGTGAGTRNGAYSAQSPSSRVPSVGSSRDLKPPPRHHTARSTSLAPALSLPAFFPSPWRCRGFVAPRRSLVRSGLPARDRVGEVFARVAERCGAAVSSSSSW